MTEILAAELCADAELLCELVHFLLEREIAEGAPVGSPRGRQRVEIAGRGELDGLQRLFGAGPADDDREMVGRAGRGAERQDLLLQEGDHAVVRQDRGRRLIEIGLVGGAAALGHEQELVGVLALGGDVDLRGQIVAGVLLLEHGERRDLAVAQVLLGIGAADARRDRRLVAALGKDLAAFLGDHDRGARVLAHRQHAAGGDIGVLQEIVGDEPVVRGRFRVVQDLGELGEVAGPQQVVDVDHRLLGERGQRRGLDDEEFAPQRLFDPHALRGQLAIGRRIGAQLKESLIVVAHGDRSVASGLRSRAPTRARENCAPL